MINKTGTITLSENDLKINGFELDGTPDPKESTIEVVRWAINKLLDAIIEYETNSINHIGVELPEINPHGIKI